MKHLLLLPCLTFVLVTTGPLSQAEDHEHTPMEQSMEIINDSYRVIARGLRKPDPSQQATFVEAATTMEAEAVKSREFMPMKIAAMPEAEQATAMESYQKEMDKFIENIRQLKAALEAGDFEKASAAINLLKVDKSEGHEAWKNN